jgi:hypothetical protein
VTEYSLTKAGEDLRPIIMAMGHWGSRWVDSKLSLKNLDPSLLMWDMRRNLFPKQSPKQRCVIEFFYPDVDSARQRYWLVVETDGSIELCHFDPGFEVNLFVRCSLRTMTSVWMGLVTFKHEVDNKKIELDGEKEFIEALPQWLGLSPFAGSANRAAA